MKKDVHHRTQLTDLLTNDHVLRRRCTDDDCKPAIIAFSDEKFFKHLSSYTRKQPTDSKNIISRNASTTTSKHTTFFSHELEKNKKNGWKIE